MKAITSNTTAEKTSWGGVVREVLFKVDLERWGTIKSWDKEGMGIRSSRSTGAR